MVRQITTLAMTVVLLAASFAVEAATLKASLDRDRIVQGETVTLVIQTNNTQQNLDTDFAVLEADFAVLDRRTETQMSIMNGQQTSVMRLMVTLEPRRSGVLSIPPLRFGSLTTDPLQLTVEAAPEPEPGATPPVFIEVEVEPKDGPFYVHAQLRLTVRVFYQQSLTEAAISQPEPTPASVRLLDEVPFQADRGGERYRVLERHYAVFPERSGPLQVPPMKLSGRLVERQSNRLWQPSARGRRIEVASDPLELDIKPKPAQFKGDAWQPARALQLSQTISATDGLKVGEPVTRTVIIDAVGLEENMISEPAWPEVTAARMYPDQPQGISRNDGKWVLGHKEFRYAVVPETAGELVLPELKVSWWDTVNDREQQAVLPAQRLQVLPSALVPPAPPAAAVPAQSQVDPAGTAGSIQTSATTPSYWKWLTFLFATLWVLTSFWLLRGGRRTPGQSATQTDFRQAEASLLETAVLKDLQQACESGDAGRVRRTLSRWLRTHGPATASGSLLEFVAAIDDASLRDRLLALDANGFRADGGSSWDGRALWQAFAGWRKEWLSRRGGHQAPVTDLYAQAAR